MGSPDLLQRVTFRLRRFTPGEYLAGLWFARRFTRHGIIVVSGGRPRPRVINRGGTLLFQLFYYAGVFFIIFTDTIYNRGTGFTKGLKDSVIQYPVHRNDASPRQ